MTQNNDMDGYVNQGMVVDPADLTTTQTKPVKQQGEFNSEQDYCKPHESGKY